jgi:hypothetical protein
VGRWISRDPSGEGSGLNLYAYATDNPIDNVDPDGLTTYTVTVQSYIEAPSAMGFQGDNHGRTSSPSNSYRTSSTVTFNTDTGTGTISSSTGTTTFLPTGSTNQANPNGMTGSVTANPDGSITVHMSGSEGNPFFHGMAPPITYNINLTLTPGGSNGTITNTNFPSYQVYVNGKRIYYSKESGNVFDLSKNHTSPLSSGGSAGGGCVDSPPSGLLGVD